MPHGMPSAITLRRNEWALDLDRTEEDGSHPTVLVPEGSVVLPQYQLADQDGWCGEWLCIERHGKRLAIHGEKLRLSVAS
jgi:hypothetical protein